MIGDYILIYDTSTFESGPSFESYSTIKELEDRVNLLHNDYGDDVSILLAGELKHVFTIKKIEVVTKYKLE